LLQEINKHSLSLIEIQLKIRQISRLYSMF
jgi:hypothetical protein